MENFDPQKNDATQNTDCEQPTAESFAPVGAEGCQQPLQQAVQPSAENSFPNGTHSSFYDPSEAYRLMLEQRWVTRLGNSVGFPLCMFIILCNALGLVLQYVVIMFWGLETALEIFTDPDMLYLISGCLTIALLTVPYLFTIKRQNLNPEDYLPFKSVSVSTTVTLTMVGIGVCAVSNYASSSLAIFLERAFGFTVESGQVDYGTGTKSFVLMLLCVGLLPALLEEFAMRGVLLSALRKKFSDGTAIVISSVLFSLLHGNLQQIPFAFGVGMILGYATVYSGSLLPAMIIHGFNNCLSVVLTFATRDASPMLGTVIMLLYYAVSLLIGICGFIMLVKTDKHALKLSCERKENTWRNVGWFAASPWIIVFFVLCVLEVIIVQVA